ncbi:MAG: 4a-hydroxytetrahydrobiopterin dehydratase, partial [Microcystis sp. M53600_WE12]|nr:4a-hydroxytetrahydrobiopterin dehydratase [Microcystis sp. M53600_WE12]
TFKFNNFIEAIAFVNRLVTPAESLGHHPDITINYNRVTLSLTTHDVGGLSNLDFDLAQQIERLIP